MDLLGSILNSMDKPPTLGDKQKQQIKKQQEQLAKNQEKEKAEMLKFRQKVEKKVNELIKDDKTQKYEFAPMEKVQRSIIHDVAEVAGLTAFSFGEEGVDRHIVLFKRESLPSEEELAALRRGETYDPEKAKQLALEKEQDEKEALESSKNKEKFIPATNYRDKYEHLIGKEAAKDAARKTETNKQYGFVPSENKKDSRSIEQTLADIRAKKKLKTNNGTSSETKADD